ncbi:MAG: DUF4124 domain-containing protein [Zoogloeaceae bacterium]|jgi:hypothetical protein|nr:DUF4124 domain-containing protein [Zoogloeaceae bacterium]
MKKALFLVLCCIGSSAFAEEVYKCQQDGKVTISTTPCPTGATATVVPVEKLPPASESPEQELARMKQQADALERERLERETPVRSAGDEIVPEGVEEVDGDEVTETAPNPQGRLNVARKKREQQAQKEKRRQERAERREARREAGGSATP